MVNMRAIVRPATRHPQPNIGPITAVARTMFGQKARITDLAELAVVP
ncbi:hypothetical protein ABZ915_04215 [Streptomyces sp. NPDC046915]